MSSSFPLLGSRRYLRRDSEFILKSYERVKKGRRELRRGEEGSCPRSSDDFVRRDERN